MVPCFSGHAAAGSTTSASAEVSVGWWASLTTTSSAASSAARAALLSGSETTGLVAAIQTALIRPSRRRRTGRWRAGPGAGMDPRPRPQWSSIAARSPSLSVNR